jgi:HK97 family phage portal protein
MGLLSRLSEFAFGDDAPVSRVEPTFVAAAPGAVTRSSSDDDAGFWAGSNFSIPSVTGIQINQWSALNSSPVVAATTMLAEDVAKLPWTIKRNASGEAQQEEKGHYLYDLLQEPNEWQNGLEFKEQLQVGLILRGNGYAPIIRNPRGVPIKLVAVNSDWCALWEAPDGSLFYRVTPQGLHMQAVLRESEFFRQTGMFPASDMLHIRGFSVNGLLGASRITLAREAIALGLAQEQQAARWMGQGAKPSGMLTTDQKLGKDTAERLKSDFKSAAVGLQNSGKVIIGEQGLKFEKFGMSSQDLEFIASRKFQLEEVARIFRIPMHMIGELSRSTNNNVAQQAQEYINFTLTGYTRRWQDKMSQCFGLRKDNLTVEFDFRALTQADLTSRINNWRTMIMSMMGKPDEARIDLGLDPEGGDAAKLQHPSNMAAGGSQSTGNQDGGGRPPADQP